MVKERTFIEGIFHIFWFSVFDYQNGYICPGKTPVWLKFSYAQQQIETTS